MLPSMNRHAVEGVAKAWRVQARPGAEHTLADLHDTVAIHPTSAEEVVLMR